MSRPPLASIHHPLDRPDVDGPALLELVRQIRAEPGSRDAFLVINALSVANKGTPNEYLWNKLLAVLGWP